MHRRSRVAVSRWKLQVAIPVISTVPQVDLRSDWTTTKDTKSTKMEFDGLSNRVIGCAIEVHRALGPGLLESAYEQCLAHELR